MPFVDIVVSRNNDQHLVKTLAQGALDRTAKILRKNPDLTAVAVRFVPPSQWMVGGRSLQELGLSSYRLEIRTTQGTNTKEEKAAYLAAIHAFMGEVLGPLHEASYTVVQEIPSDAWGYGGLSQHHRQAERELVVKGEGSSTS
jgi:4-oxalocrotonate tautomerase